MDTLFVPMHAPWLKVSESVDFVRAVRPGRAFALHDALLNDDRRPDLRRRMLERLSGSDYARLAPGTTIRLTCPAATDELIRRLYAAPPDRFVAARDRRGRGREEGRRPGRRQAARRAEEADRGRLAGQPARAAPARADRPSWSSWPPRCARPSAACKGDELRELSTQRRQVVSALVTAGPQAGRGRGPPAGAKLPLGEVEATLTAALAEPEVAAQVRTGRLIRAASYAGLRRGAAAAAAAGHRRGDRGRRGRATRTRSRGGGRGRRADEEPRADRPPGSGPRPSGGAGSTSSASASCAGS